MSTSNAEDHASVETFDLTRIAAPVKEDYPEVTERQQSWTDRGRGRKSDDGGQPPTDRLGMFWASKWLALAVIIGLPVLTFAISSALSASYTSTSVISVSARGTSSVSPMEVVNASNGLASQVAQLVTTDDVKMAAARQLGRTTLEGNVTAATAANQNLVVISVTGRQPAEDRREAGALAEATLAYVTNQSKSSAKSYSASVAAGLTALNSAIQQAQTQLNVDRATAKGAAAGLTLAGDQTALENLLLRKQTLLSQAAVDGSSQQSAVTIVSSASNPSKVSPKPVFYSLIALAVAIILGVELTLIIGRARLASARRK